MSTLLSLLLCVPSLEAPRARVDLGQRLFFDRRLSRTGAVSCASCHDLSDGGNGAGHDAVSTGIEGRRGTRNAPTVWNAGARSVLFWDGRASSLEEQARGPLLNPDEMGMPSEDAVVATVRNDERYRAAFLEAFDTDTPSFEQVVAAIAAFERTLVTAPSPFDRWRAGDSTALSARALEGWRLFRTIGCLACHGTPTFTTNDVFQRFPHRDAREAAWLFGFTADRGRGDVTQQAVDDHRWRVPSLRNVATTAPYFHNGSVPTLPQAVRVMARVQLARELSAQEVDALVAFLESLTGRPPQVTRIEW